MAKHRSGFTLIELVIVIVILGILASLALPRFVDIVTDARVSATQAGLGALRAVIALQYAQRIAGGTTPYYTTTITADNFFDGRLPVNRLNTYSAVTALAAAGTATNPTSAAYGWWFVTTGTQAGQAGAYSDGTQATNTW